MQVALAGDLKAAKKDVRIAKEEAIRAITNSFERFGLFIEARAVQRVKVSSGYTRQRIHSEPVHYNRETDTTSVRVVADSPYSIYLEMGFQGHFVPFDKADSLYYAALRQWGWRVPVPGQVHDPKPGRKYLIPRGRKNPVWGVFIKGTAHPFMKPALEDLTKEIQYAVIREEFQKMGRSDL